MPAPTQTQVASTINTNLPDNTDRQISPLDVRQALYQMLASGTPFKAYDGTRTYSEGEACLRNNRAYVCTASSTTGAFNETDWQEVLAVPPSAKLITHALNGGF